MDILTLIVLALIMAFILKFYKFYTSPKGLNPFLKDDCLVLKNKVTDQKERDNILKQNFKQEKVNDSFDAIVIGSGIGGLTTAAILSKAGKKVLVLEQHDQAGGCCHTFIDKGYEFDVGIHYIGEMSFQSVSKTLLDQISDGQITWEELDENYDSVVFNEEGQERRIYPVVKGMKNQIEKIKSYFPGEEDGIDKFYSYVMEVEGGKKSAMIVKFIPLWLANLLIKTPILNWITSQYKWNERTVRDVVNECTSNQYLRDFFCYCFGDYGTVPSEAGFPMQATLLTHFWKGASYPIGGASEFAYNIIPVIERSGGKVLVNAKVMEILLDEKDKAVGVKMIHGKTETCVKAPKIISNAGLSNTMCRFLPESLASQSRLWPLAKHAKPGVGAISVFVGFDAPKEQLDIGIKRNYWIFDKPDIDKSCREYIALSREECEDAGIPLAFLSFPSTKDPTWDERYPGKTTMAIVTLANYDWFESWDERQVMKRGDDYEAMKKTIGHKLIKIASDLFPKIENHIDYVNVGTPLSNNYYIGSQHGEIYGLDHSQSRFSAWNTALLRPETDIEGLFLTGQDVCGCGLIGGMWGGVFCAQTVLGRNVINDLVELHKKVKIGSVKDKVE